MVHSICSRTSSMGLMPSGFFSSTFSMNIMSPISTGSVILPASIENACLSRSGLSSPFLYHPHSPPFAELSSLLYLRARSENFSPALYFAVISFASFLFSSKVAVLPVLRVMRLIFALAGVYHLDLLAS